MGSPHHSTGNMVSFAIRLRQFYTKTGIYFGRK
ncbi:unnamed protein product [Medioppia subpectinata]|uniref:Uncharacterized protein n=1 Tax=Medioppia subpectinata TaxID=1979941 RepID=A0A7R9LZ23_9ACAR|nr:unnamed protein product [Medioppia subpectinata]CAG2122363.1 unnamed protein product [Medioppia subpectinata]